MLAVRMVRALVTRAVDSLVQPKRRAIGRVGPALRLTLAARFAGLVWLLALWRFQLLLLVTGLALLRLLGPLLKLLLLLLARLPLRVLLGALLGLLLQLPLRLLLPHRLFLQGALADGIFGLPALLLLLTRRVHLLALLVAAKPLLLVARALLGFKRASVRRCAGLRQGGRNHLHRLAGPGLLAEKTFNRATQAGIALWGILAGLVRALISSVITPLFTPLITPTRWLQLAGHHGPNGDGSGRQCARAGTPRQVAQTEQARQARRQATPLRYQHLGAAQVRRVQALRLGTHALAARKVVAVYRAHGVLMALVAVVVSSVDVVDHDVVVHVADVTRAVLIGRAKCLAGRQRKPAQAGLRGLLADGHIPVHAAGVAADKSDQRGPICAQRP